MAELMMLPVQELRGDGDDSTAYLVTPKTALGGLTLESVVSAFPIAMVAGPDLLILVPGTAGPQPVRVQELLGDDDPNNLYLLVPKATIGNNGEGATLDAVPTAQRNGEPALLVIAPLVG